MKKMVFAALSVMLLWAGVFPACSEKKDAPSEKSGIEKMTAEKGQELADKLSAPIEKARKAAEQETNRVDEMIKTTDDQQ